MSRGRSKQSTSGTALRRKGAGAVASAPWHEAALFQKRQIKAIAARDVLNRSQMSRNSSKGKPSARRSELSTSRSAATGVGGKSRLKAGVMTAGTSFGRMT